MGTLKTIKIALHYILLIGLGLFLIFPLVYLFFSSFKSNQEIFGALKILPTEFLLDGYINGWKGSGQVSFGRYMINSFVLVLPTVLFTVVSSAVVAYGFSRFRFPLKKLLFGIMLALMMLPSSVLMIPRYLLYAKIAWIDSYKPFWVPSLLATSSFFVYMFIQFFRGLPKELDEAATIDGCGTLGVFGYVLLPLCKPAVISASIFQFIWTWNDFFQQYIYISSVGKYTASLGLRMAIDATATIQWNNILAMSVISMVPCIVVFLCLQKYFIEGIATSGLKG